MGEVAQVVEEGSLGNARLLGQGDHVLVLSHGLGGSLKIWDKLLPHLLPRYRVLVYDLPGHGMNNSYNLGNIPEDHLPVLDAKRNVLLQRFAKHLLDILDEFHIKRCTFVGHSVSGMLGCLASLARPKLFTKLILLGASSRYLNDTGYCGGFEPEQVENLLLAIQQDSEAWVREFVPLALGSNASEAAVQEYTSSFLMLDPKFLQEISKAIFCSDFRSILPDVKVPCHLIQTSTDVAVPYEAAKFLHKELGSVEKSLEILDIEGHLPHLTSPDLLVPSLLELLVME